MWQNRKQHQNKTVAYWKIYGTWAISYRLNKMFLDIDYTGNLYGRCQLDFRPTKRIFAYLEHSEYQFTFNKLKT
jgi:outer membrane receptor for ferrienterochelin and colicins